MDINSSEAFDPITFQITYQAKDLTEASRLYQRTTHLHLVLRLIAMIGFITGSCGIALFTLDLLRLPELFSLGFPLGLFDTLPLYLPWIAFALVPTSLLLWWRPFRPFAVWLDFQLNNARYQQPIQVTIDHTGIAGKTLTAEWRHYWSAFSKIIESDKLFLLVLDRWQYAVLPKRAFDHPGTIERFGEVVQMHMGPNQRA